jgi:enoyl-CoA hydratase/carnithine racemase
VSAQASTVLVDLEVSDRIATLELRRPAKRNAISGEMLWAILAHLRAAADRSDVRTLVLRGAGGTFSAGADLACVKDGQGVQSAAFESLFTDVLDAIAGFPAPTVAQVDGACVGGGCALALACDVRFASRGAFFAIPATRHGIVYEAASIARLVRAVGHSRAARMLYAAQRVDATTAERWGLVDECGDDVSRIVAGFVADVALGDADTITATRALVRQAVGGVS